MSTKAGIATALMFVLVASMAGASIATALPEDVAKWDTPSERAWIYAGELKDLERLYIIGGMTDKEVKYNMYRQMYRYSDMLNEYRDMYEYIETHVMGADGFGKQATNGNIESLPSNGTFWVENLGFSCPGYWSTLGNGSFSFDTVTGQVEFAGEGFSLDASIIAFNQIAGAATLIDVVLMEEPNIGLYSIRGPVNVTF